jgi:hypothetical protein
MKSKSLLYSIMVVLSLALFLSVSACAEEKTKEEKKAVEKEAAKTEVKEEGDMLDKVIKETMGKGVKVLRKDAPEKAPIAGWLQTRIWIKSVYGETPVLYYSSEDGTFIFGGSIFDSSGENLTKRDVGTTIPKVLDSAKVDLNENYIIGKKDAPVKVALWIGGDPYSKELYNTFFDLYEANKDKMALYIKFYPLTVPDMEKTKALTCFKGDALAKGFKTVFTAAQGWGNKDELNAFKQTGSADVCREDQVMDDIKIAAENRFPRHPVAFVNWTMLIDKAVKENIEKLAGIELK